MSPSGDEAHPSLAISAADRPTVKTRVLFVIPLVGKANCRSWTSVCSTLQQTLNCITRQTCENWHVFVVCNEIPDVDVDQARTTFLICDLPLKSERPGARSLDKQKKLHFGMIHAASIQPDFIMFLDGDDRISNRLVSFVANHEDTEGFIITSGYLYQPGSRWLVRLNQFHLSCGSCYLFRYRQEEAPTSMDQSRDDFWMIKAHNKAVRAHFEARGARCVEFPFPAGIYMRGHEDSIRNWFSKWEKDSRTNRLAQLRNSLRRAARFLLRSVAVSESHEAEFGKLRQIDDRASNG
ncbi:MAG: glycosyltransferase family 2 protein [Planctomycetaceae bacterium]|nr:glycosyltransferase family 2 protein [Planctomycetaceae bacterium]